jgi:hypothetical protein
LVGSIVVAPILFIALMYNLLKPSNLVSWPLIFKLRIDVEYKLDDTKCTS